jgi:hypothetical protein
MDVLHRASHTIADSRLIISIEYRPRGYEAFGYLTWRYMNGLSGMRIQCLTDLGIRWVQKKNIWSAWASIIWIIC